jgi:hypothetical protein
VRYPHAIWKGASSSDFSAGKITPRFVVIHIAQGSSQGTTAWFHNPEAQVSAHFMNPKAGPMLQYVDTDQEAWAEMAYNGVGISVEHEGYSGEHLTATQLDNLARLLEWTKKVYRIPTIWRPDAFGASGIVSHGSLGVAGGDHPDCPGINIDNDVRNLTNRLNKVKGYAVRFTR